MVEVAAGEGDRFAAEFWKARVSSVPPLAWQ
jgi:hypothetical protein